MDIFEIQPGKEIGEILNKIFEMVMDSKIKNDRVELMHYMKLAKGNLK